MATIKFENGMSVNFEGTPTPQDVEEVYQKISGGQSEAAPQQQKPGFVQSVVQGIAKPFLGIASNIRAIPGIISARSNAEVDQAVNKKYDYGYLGKEGTLQNPAQSIGAGLQIGSLAIPGGASTIPRAALAGGAISGLSATGSTLQDGGSVSDALLAGAEAVPVGAITGGVFKTAAKAVKPVTEAIKSTTGFAVKQATGLSPQTVKIAFKTPEKLTEAQASELSRNAIADEVAGAINKGIEDLHATGKEYQTIRGLNKGVEVQGNPFKEVLAKYGLGVEDVVGKDGKLVDANIVKSSESVPLGAGDIKDLKDFYLQYGKESRLSANGLLNARQGADKLKRYGVGMDKTDVSEKIAGDLRTRYDEIAHQQLPELKAVDAKYAPQRKMFQKLQKDYLNADGTLKDNAINKISNLTGAGRREVLGRLEEVVPGIGEKINLSRALEDVTAASGQKVGTYTRAAVLGGAGLATGNIPVAIASALISNPQVAVKIIQQFGRANNRIAPVVNRVLSKMSTGGKLSSAEKKLVQYAIGQYFADDVPKKETNTDPATDEYLKSLGY